MKYLVAFRIEQIDKEKGEVLIYPSREKKLWLPMDRAIFVKKRC